MRYLQDNAAEFGRLRAVEVSSCVFWDGPQAPWWAERTPDEGLIVSLFAPHSLDFIQLAMETFGGGAPSRVHAEGARHQSGWQGEDEAMIVMAWPGRRMASLHLSYNQLPIHDRKVLFFDRGLMEIEHGEFLRWNGTELVTPPPGMVSDPSRMGGRDLAHYFSNQLSEFARAMQGQPHRCPSGEAAALGIELLDGFAHRCGPIRLTRLIRLWSERHGFSDCACCRRPCSRRRCQGCPLAIVMRAIAAAAPNFIPLRRRRLCRQTPVRLSPTAAIV